MESNPIADKIISQHNSLKGEQDNWRTYWQDIADFVLPLKNNIAKEFAPGERRNEQILDGTAIAANDKLASGMFGYMCPAHKQWFIFRAKDPEIAQDEEVQWYFTDVSHKIMKYMYESHFALEIHEDFLDMGGFGTSNLYIEEGIDTPLHFKNIPIQSYTVMESAYGIIDTCNHEFKLTARQAVQMFGEKNLPDNVMESLKSGSSSKANKKFTFIHSVSPRKDWNPKSLNKKHKRFASYYIEKESRQLIREGGYDENPYIVGRFMKNSAETYGRSPAMNALTFIKMLNRMRATVIRAAEKIVDKPIMMSDDSVVGDIDLGPGGLLYIRGSRWENRPQVLDMHSDVPIGLEMIEREQVTIRDMFYNEMFDALANKSYMTKAEVIERVDLQMTLFAPILARVQSEKLSPTLHRCYGILARKGLLPPPPEVLLERPGYEVQYTGKLALALDELDVSAFRETMMEVQPLFEMNPNVADNFDPDAAVRGIALRKGVPQEFMKSQKEVADLREQRNEQMQQERQMEMINKSADAASKLQKTTEPNSPLGNMGEAMEGMMPQQ